MKTLIQCRPFLYGLSLYFLVDVPLTLAADPKIDGLVNSISQSVGKMVEGLKKIDRASPAGKKKSTQDDGQMGPGSVADGGGGPCGVGADTVATNFRDSGVLKELEDSKGELKDIVAKDGKKITELGENFKNKKLGRAQFSTNFLEPVKTQVKASLYDVIYKEGKAAALLTGVNQGSAKGKLFFANFYRKWKFGSITDPAAEKSYAEEANSSRSQYSTIKKHLCSQDIVAKQPVCKNACEGFENFYSELNKIVSEKFPALRSAMNEQVAMAQKQEAVLVGTQDVPVTTAGGPLDVAKAGTEQAPPASGVSEGSVAKKPEGDLSGTETSSEKAKVSAMPENSDLAPAPRPVITEDDKKQSSAGVVGDALKMQKGQDKEANTNLDVAQGQDTVPPLGNNSGETVDAGVAAAEVEDTTVAADDPIVGEPAGESTKQDWGVAQEVVDNNSQAAFRKDPNGNDIVPIFPDNSNNGVVVQPQQNVKLSRETFASDEILKKNDIDLYSDHDSRILQKTINQVYEQNNGVGVEVDGVAGSRTLSAYQNIMNDPKLKAQFEDAWRKQGMYVPRAPASSTASK